VSPVNTVLPAVQSVTADGSLPRSRRTGDRSSSGVANGSEA